MEKRAQGTGSIIDREFSYVTPENDQTSYSASEARWHGIGIWATTGSNIVLN